MNRKQQSLDQIPESGERKARLEFRDVARRFIKAGTRNETIAAVENLSLSVHEGEIVSIIGPSGCGKSTLLNMASGLTPPSAGEVYVDGVKVTAPNDHVGFMLQKDLLLPWRTIRENVEIGMEIQGVDKALRRERTNAWLARCHIEDFADNYPGTLSGGMRQRAALARTMVINPSVLLLDEPFSALDAQTKMVLQSNLAEVLGQAEMTALFITHDLLEAVILSDRVLVMSRRPGKIIKEIIIDLPDRQRPMERRKHPGVTDYVNQLMSLLPINEDVPGGNGGH